jgi:HAD superfamily hydrolase (TIGR01549 family)
LGLGGVNLGSTSTVLDALQMGVGAMKVEAVLFDLGGTLIVSKFSETFRKILQLKGIKRPVRAVEKAMAEAELELKKQFGDDVPKDVDYYSRWNLGILHLLNVYDRDSELAKHIDKYWFDYMEVRLLPGAIEVLKRLVDQGVKVGIVTNGYESDLDKIVPILGVGNIFDVLVAADSLGRRKPDPEVFLYAVRKLKVPPSSTVFVGDEYDTDYIGAEKAGLIPFLLRIKQRIKMKGVPTGTNVIRSLPELLLKLSL